MIIQLRNAHIYFLFVNYISTICPCLSFRYLYYPHTRNPKYVTIAHIFHLFVISFSVKRVLSLDVGSADTVISIHFICQFIYYFLIYKFRLQMPNMNFFLIMYCIHYAQKLKLYKKESCQITSSKTSTYLVPPLLDFFCIFVVSL